ncbi:MAG: CopD family protein [Pseudomonadota bacterium]
MYNSIKLLHLVAGIVWMGGMTFMLLALRPAALEVLEPQVRARLMGAVWRRFFSLVLVAIAVLLLTGGHMYMSAFKAAQLSSGGAVSVPLGWSLMLIIGLVMVLIFGHVYFAGFKKFKHAVAANAWPIAGQAAAQINRLVVINFVLGWLAIAAVRLVH